MDPFYLVFLAVVENKSFTKAAKQLHMTQPAVSQAIHNLEEKIGTTLIERKQKSFHLNKAGEVVYAYAKKMQAKHVQMQTIVAELKEEPAGTLIVGASYTIGEYIVPKILQPLHEAYPLIEPHVMIGNTETIVQKLFAHEIDIGLVEGTVDDPRLESKAFMTDEMYMIAGRGHPVQKETSILDLAAYTWIIRENGSGTRKMTEALMETYEIQPAGIYTFGSTQIIKEAVEAGLGISLLSQAALKKELQLETIQVLPLAELPVKRDFSMIKMRQEFQTKTIQVFEALLQKYF